MSRPVFPVVKGTDLSEINTIYGENQAEYENLPCLKFDDGTVITRWALNWKERFIALFTGNIYVWVQTYNNPIQPLLVEAQRPRVADEGFFDKDYTEPRPTKKERKDRLA